MSGFVIRREFLPGVEDLTAIEQVVLVDRTPRTPTTGVGQGTLMVVGEFEDGDFNLPTKTYGQNDEVAKFGGFGYDYGDLKYQNPCARIHGGESWNGNGYLKGLTAPRYKQKVITRVDTSVGDERFTLAAGMRTDPQTFNLPNAAQMSVTTDAGGPANSTAVVATVATVAGGALGAALVDGERISIGIDDDPLVTITFQAADVAAAQICARINGFLGYTAAVVNGAAVDISSKRLGSTAEVSLADIDAGTLAKIGHVAGDTNPVGNNVANAAAVTAAEVVTLVQSAGILAINGAAVADTVTGEVMIYRTGSSAGTIQVADVAGAMATVLGLTTGAAGLVTANVGDAFTVPAGTRVQNAGGDEWLTMRTIEWPVGTAAAPNDASQDVEIRPSNDIGTLAAEVAGQIVVLVDIPDRMVEVTNPANVSAALSDAQIDAAYVTAFNSTLNIMGDARTVTDVICARTSAIVKSTGRSNAISASEEGCYWRTFYARGTIGWTQAQAIADRALYASDKVFYSWPNWRMYVPEIAALGTAGGVGFTADGIIDVGSDGPLASLHCVFNPEENVCQSNSYLAHLLGLDSTITPAVLATLTKTAYIALKAAGICAPRLDQSGALCYQSEVTASLVVGRTTQKRSKMAGFIQDSLAVIGLRYMKKLATDARKAGLDADIDSFLAGLLSVNNPNAQRIRGYTIEDVTTADQEALGIAVRQVRVQLPSSLDVIVFDTEVGEGVVLVDEAA